MVAHGKLTVFFEDPFWVGVYERVDSAGMEVCRIVFGAEPKDYEVYDYFVSHYCNLHFSPPVHVWTESEHRKNPKRVQRAIQKQLASPGIATKAQQALKLLQEQSQQERKVRRREKMFEEKQRMFDLRQQKKKEKHKGH